MYDLTPELSRLSRDLLGGNITLEGLELVEFLVEHNEPGQPIDTKVLMPDQIERLKKWGRVHNIVFASGKLMYVADDKYEGMKAVLAEAKRATVQGAAPAMLEALTKSQKVLSQLFEFGNLSRDELDVVAKQMDANQKVLDTLK